MSNEPAATSDDDVLAFDDEPDPTPVVSLRPWKILIVDDEPDVHDATHFALRDTLVFDRPLEFLHAHSASEGLALARADGEIAVALVDVVMETPDAGLRLVHDLRRAGLTEMRIILRTAYPGYAPEMSVVTDYEIDDYRTKDELTRTRLLTVLTASLRAYSQLRMIARSRAGLQMIVESASMLFRRPNLELLSQGVLTQIASLVGTEANGFVYATTGADPCGTHDRIVSAAGRFAGLIGQPRSSVTDQASLALLAESAQTHGPVIRGGAMAMQFRSEDGRAFGIFFDAHAEVSDTDLDLLMLFSANIAVGFENLALVELLDRLAYVDPILSTPNLNAFETELASRLRGASPRGRLAISDVDSFRAILAAHGPRVAHDLLRAMYGRLRSTAGEPLSIARIGDGTFGLIGSRDVLADDLVPAAIEQPFDIDGVRIAPTATTAIVDLDGADTDPMAVTQSALSALLHVKQHHLGQSIVFDAEMRAEVERGHLLRTQLECAIEHGDGLSVHLQPKVDLSTGRTVGAEALLRWSLDGEQVSPADFIPIAEAAGLTLALTDFVVDTVARWQAERCGAGAVPVAVNLSMADLNAPGFSDRLLQRVSAAGLGPSTLEFEVTEGIAMHSAGSAMHEVAVLKAGGFHIAIDDFGTGYSSIGQVDRLPVDIVKIDRRFVSTLGIETARHSIAAVVLAMSEVMNAACVAEGIETEEQRQALLFLGCRIGQGFLLGRPVPIGDFAARFLQHGDEPSAQ